MASMAGPINVWIDLHYLLVPPVCKTPASIVLWVLVWPRNWTPNFCAFSNILVQLSSTALALTIRHGVGKSWIFLPTWLGYGILRNEFFLDNWTQLLNCLVILHIWRIFYTEIFLDTSIWIFTPKISTNYNKYVFLFAWLIFKYLNFQAKIGTVIKQISMQIFGAKIQIFV